jgi:peptidoglycan/LPS O-acetylase OafA/YrhL
LPGQIIFAAICFPAFFGAALLSWHLFEKHFLKLKRFVPMGNAAGTTAKSERALPRDETPVDTAPAGAALAAASGS